MLRFKSNIWLLQEDVDMTGPAGHLQMELCSLNRKSCRQWNLVPAFIKFRSSHLSSPQYWWLSSEEREVKRAPSPDNERAMFYESSAKLWNNEHREKSQKSCKRERKKHILHYFGKFSFSVWLHCTTAPCSGLPELQGQVVGEPQGTYQGRVGGITTALGPHELQGLQLSLALKGHQERPA